MINFKDEIIEEIHLKWLSKAKTAIINGEEMTVLPYGYLTQAVKEALDQVIARTDKWLPEERKPDIGLDQNSAMNAGHNDCRSLYLSNKQKDLDNK